MSRKPNHTTSVVKPSSAPSTALPSDLCPVCKRVRYLNTDMEFLINPECYHPMCSNCVTNIFKSGPAQCPYPSCTKTLRQRGFRSAFFGDLAVEREVDIRRRVQAAFNNVEDDFETLRDYNNYLQDVEDLTFDLIYGGDDERAGAEAKLLAREQHFKDEIERNRRRGREAELSRQKRDAAEAEAQRRRRLEERREEDRARAEEATINAEVMEALARGEPGSAAEIQARIVARKRARVAEISSTHFSNLLNLNDNHTPNTNTNNANNTNTNNISSSSSSSSSTADPNNKNNNNNNMLSIRGLRAKKRPGGDDDDGDAGPYDPFAGMSLEPARYRLGDRYDNPWLDGARARDDHRVPGYSVHEYAARAMFEAFAGLSVVVADEKSAAAAATTNTNRRGVSNGTGGRMDVDDVF
ncbi:CDK-activating kinase assembly factor MAT1-domain-containing protein [Biscogniauxia marginata]|nr:CDK-activating kinase assembly factor MAT1-domain-containing protein [Biscogniauxia marginata]